MYQADLYANNKNLQMNDIDKIVEETLKLLVCISDDEIILDAGCGIGDVTKNILLREFPNVKQIVGADISEELLDFAKLHNSHEKIHYRHVDLGECHIPKELHKAFDHIVSFHVFHWIPNHRNLFHNLHEMLKPRGDVLATFVIRTNLNNVYDLLAKIPKWSCHMKNCKTSFPYKEYENAKVPLENVVTNAGFAHIIKFEDKQFIFHSEEEFINTMSAINPFLKNIPKEEHFEYMKDFLESARKMEFFKGSKIILCYQTALLYLRKLC